MSDSTMKFDLFDLPTNEIIKEINPKSEYEVYKPGAKDGKDNVYKALIKFLPWHKDVTKSVMSKWTVWLTHPDRDESRMIDCPSTIKQPSILQQVFFGLRKSPNASENELASNFGRREQFHSLIQIIKDPNEPENEGKIKVFKYGKKIYDKIKSLANPEEGMDIEPNNPFDIFKGKPFMLQIKLVAGYNNYDDSFFLDKEQPLLIKGSPVENNKKNYDMIRKYLEENSPDLEKYDFHPWDVDTKDFVISAIQAIVPQGKVLESIFKKGAVNSPVVDRVNKVNNINTPKTKEKFEIDLSHLDKDEETAPFIDVDSDEIDDYLGSSKAPKAPAAKKATPKPATKAAVEISDDDLDLFGDL